MDSEAWYQSLQPLTGSKRPSRRLYDEQIPQAKRLRTQPCDNRTGREIPSSRVGFPQIELPSADPNTRRSSHFVPSWGDVAVSGLLSNTATDFSSGYSNQCGVLSGNDSDHGSNFGNGIAISNLNANSGMDRTWDISLQNAYQGHGNHSNTTTGLNRNLGHQVVPFMDRINPTPAQDATQGYNFCGYNAGLYSIHSQAIGNPLPLSMQPVRVERREDCYDYDTCFGVVSRVFPPFCSLF